MTDAATDWDALEKPKARVRVGKPRKGAPTERTVQRAVNRALGKLGFWTVAVPNGTHLAGGAEQRMRQMAALRADGLTRGALDLIVMASGGRVGWLEVKKEGGHLSEAQLGFMARLDKLGIPCAAVCTVEDAVKAVREWGW